MCFFPRAFVYIQEVRLSLSEHFRVLSAVHKYYAAIVRAGLPSPSTRPPEPIRPPTASAPRCSASPRCTNAHASLTLRRAVASLSPPPLARLQGQDRLSSDTAPHQLHLPEFLRFCEEAFVPDEHSKACKRAQLASLFNGANFKPTSTSAPAAASGLAGLAAAAAGGEGGGEGEGEGDIESARLRRVSESNLDDALTRHEWLNAVVRLAMAKYSRGGSSKGATVRVAEAVDAFCREHVYSRSRDGGGGAVVPVALPPEAMADPNEFRRGRLYSREVDDVVRGNMTFLVALYALYAADPQFNDAEGYKITSQARRQLGTPFAGLCLLACAAAPLVVQSLLLLLLLMGS